MDQTERKALGDVFDRTIRSMNGLPDVLTTKATTVRSPTSHEAKPRRQMRWIAKRAGLSRALRNVSGNLCHFDNFTSCRLEILVLKMLIEVTFEILEFHFP